MSRVSLPRRQIGSTKGYLPLLLLLKNSGEPITLTCLSMYTVFYSDNILADIHGFCFLCFKGVEITNNPSLEPIGGAGRRKRAIGNPLEGMPVDVNFIPKVSYIYNCNTRE